MKMKQIYDYKRVIMTLLALIVSIGTFAYDAKLDGLCYNLNNETKEASVTYEFEQLWHSRCSGDVTIPSTITYNNIVYSVTSIGDCAFDCADELTSVIIPNSVKSIGRRSFAYCSALKSITIPNSVTIIRQEAFEGCFNIKSIVVGNSVKIIEYGAFNNCYRLTDINIPESVTSIGAYAFYRCDDLPSLKIPDSVKEIGSNAFCSCGNLSSITLSNSITNIYSKTFSGCGLTSITIPESVTDIRLDAFEFCSKLTSITIPNSVKSIGQCAFYSCESLTSVTIGNSVEDIEWGAFAGCISLNSITIPNSVKNIGGAAFKGCSALSSVIIGNSVTYIGEEAFDNSALISVTIPKSVTNIEGSPFSGCLDLQTIIVDAGNKVYDSRNNCNAIVETSTNTLIAGCKNTIIPNSIKSIGAHAFQDCSSLTSIIIPNSVTSIGGGAFSNCSGLTSFTIPESVTSIGDHAFYISMWSSPAFSSVTNYSVVPQEITESTFNDSYGRVLHVLLGCKEAYENSVGWNNFDVVEDAVALTPESVIALIKAIGTVKLTDACKKKIAAARAAYDALSNDQQALVNNYKVLVQAEEAYNKLSAPTNVNTVAGTTDISADKIFSLSGQQVVKVQKGLNIINGNKVIVR